MGRIVGSLWLGLWITVTIKFYLCVVSEIDVHQYKSREDCVTDVNVGGIEGTVEVVQRFNGTGCGYNQGCWC